MRRFFRCGAATAALLALVCGGVAVTPAIATGIEDTPVTALEDGGPTLPPPPSEGGTATVEELVVVEFDIVGVAVSGVAQVGQTLTSAIEFSLTPDYVEFLWFAGDELIEGVEGDTTG